MVKTYNNKFQVRLLTPNSKKSFNTIEEALAVYNEDRRQYKVDIANKYKNLISTEIYKKIINYELFKL
jgi:hypothetical protein